MKSGILEEKCRFFPKRFLVKFVKPKGLKLTEEHILTLLNKKSKNQARSSKNDLHEFEGKIRKFAQNSRNFRIWDYMYQESNCHEHKFKPILK